jgi:hypothetical protein
VTVCQVDRWTVVLGSLPIWIAKDAYLELNHPSQDHVLRRKVKMIKRQEFISEYLLSDRQKRSALKCRKWTAGCIVKLAVTRWLKFTET